MVSPRHSSICASHPPGVKRVIVDHLQRIQPQAQPRSKSPCPTSCEARAGFQLLQRLPGALLGIGGHIQLRAQRLLLGLRVKAGK